MPDATPSLAGLSSLKRPTARRAAPAATPPKAEKAPAKAAAPAVPAHATMAAADEMSALQAMLATVTAQGDIDKVERVLGMLERIKAARALVAWRAAMAAAQAEIGPVVRSAENDDKGNRYAPLEAIVEAITPITKAHGFGLTIQTRNAEAGFIKVLADALHTGGHSERFEYDIPVETGLDAEGNVRMTAPQTYGTTTTFGRRYATCMIFNVATKSPEMRDRDGETKQPASTVSEAQVTALEAAMRTKDLHPKKFCARFKVRSVSELPAARFDEAIKAIAAVEG